MIGGVGTDCGLEGEGCYAEVGGGGGLVCVCWGTVWVCVWACVWVCVCGGVCVGGVGLV